MDHIDKPFLGLIIYILFLMINNILNGYESALFELDDNDFDEDIDNKDKKTIDGILKLRSNRSFFRTTIRIVSAISNIVMGGLLLDWFVLVTKRFDIKVNSIVVGLVIIALMFLFFEIFAGIIPEKFAKKEPKKYALKHYNMTKCLINIFSPFTKLVMIISNLFLKIIGINPYDNDDSVTEEEIMDMVNEGHEQGVLEENEAEMIENIFEFGDKDAADVMVHRKNIISVDAGDTLDVAVKIFLEEGLSRVPVYEGELDNVIGILHFKDAFRQYEDASKRKLTVLAFKDMLYDAHLVPETRSISSLFEEMQEAKVHMSMVVDEYGQIVGLVTMEDIIEEIFGNIFDEHDDADTSVKKQSENVYVVDGLIALRDIEELLDVTFDEDDVDTLNGFITKTLGHIPESKEDVIIRYKGFSFKAIKIEKNIITKVRITRNVVNSEAV